MKRLKFTISAVAFLITMTSLAFQREKRDVGEFESLSVSSADYVYIKIGNSFSVELEGDDLDEVETEVQNGNLKIGRERGWSGWGDNDLEVYITVPTLNAIRLSGSSKVEVDGVLKNEVLKLVLSGSGKLTSKINTGELDIVISGSGKVNLEGKSETVETKISGSGKIDAEDLVADYVDNTISGSGSIYITVNKELDSSISGSGSIYYKGSPSKVNTHSSGSGKTKKIG